MNGYKEMKERHQKEFDKFPMFFAFNNKQFEEGMKELGLNPSDTDKIYSFHDTGGYFRKSDAPALRKMLDRQRREMKRAMNTDDKFAFDMFNYELGNHEYIVTGSVENTLDALGLTADKVNSDPRLLKALNEACKAQREWYAKQSA